MGAGSEWTLVGDGECSCIAADVSFAVSRST